MSMTELLQGTPCLDLRPAPQEGIRVYYHKPIQKPVTGETLDPKGNF